MWCVRTHNRDGRGTRRMQRYVGRAASRSSRPVCHTNVSTTPTTTTRQPTNERDSARAHTLGHGGATRNSRHTAHTPTLTREDFDLTASGAAWHAVQVCDPDEFSQAVADVRLCASRFNVHGGRLKRITANSTRGCCGGHGLPPEHHASAREEEGQPDAQNRSARMEPH